MQSTIDVVEDGGRNLVVHLTGKGDGVSGERNVLKVPGRVKVKSIRGGVTGGLVTLAWSGLTPKPFAVIGGKHKTGDSAPLPAPTEGRGDILLSTSGFGPDSSYSLTLELVRKKPLPKPYQAPQFFMTADLASVLNLDFVRQVYRVGTANYAFAAIPGLTFTRASSGFAKTSTGALTSFATDTPRITNIGLLIEPAATNLFLQSQTFDNASWTKSDVTVTADARVAPDGTMTMDKITEGVLNNQHYITQNIIVGAGPASVTLYAAAGERSWMRWGTGPASTWFDLANGVVGSSLGPATGSIEPAGPGIWRCTCNYTAPAGGDDFYCEGTPGDGIYTWQGDGTSGIYIWGADSNNSSYIATTTAAVTRAADVFSVTFSPNPGLTGTATYGINSNTVTPTLTSPINLGSSGAGAWVSDYLRKVVIRS